MKNGRMNTARDSVKVKGETIQGTLHSRSVDQFKDQLIAKALYVFHNDDNWFSMDLTAFISPRVLLETGSLTNCPKTVCT